MKHVRKEIIYVVLIISLIFGLSNRVCAAPIDKEVIELTNNYVDKAGITQTCIIQVTACGDEFYAHVETLEGYTLIRDPETSYICYAISDGNGDIISSKIVYTGLKTSDEINFEKNNEKHIKENDEIINKKVQKNKDNLNIEEIPLKTSVNDNIIFKLNSVMGAPNPWYKSQYSGSIVGLTILIDFPDVKSSITQTQVDNFCNSLNYTEFNNKGSVRQYYSDVSGGAVDYTNIVTTYYTAKHNKSYYTDPSATYGSRARELIKEALADLASKGFNFSGLSKTGNTVRAVNVLYAGGKANSWSEGLWPHQSNLGNYTVGGTTFNGYQITDIGTSVSSALTIGTFCHESGHLVFGWEDTYDYTSTSNGVGRYDLMCTSGTTNPVMPNPYFRTIRAGWGEPEIINNFISGSTIDVQANQISAQVYTKDNKEFFIVENVQPTLRWTGFSRAGLYIWHIDSNKNNNNNKDMTATLHYQVSLEQADGRFDLENKRNSGDTTDAFYLGNKTEFTRNTTPNSKWWDGTYSNLSITNISTASSVMTYIYSSELLTEIDEKINSLYEIEIADNGIKYIKNMGEKKTVNALKTTLNLSANYMVEVTNMAGTILNNSQYVGTGSTITIKNQSSQVLCMYKVVVKGDITGEGTVDIYDIMKLISYVYSEDPNFVWDEGVKRAGKVTTSPGEPRIHDIQRLISYYFEEIGW